MFARLYDLSESTNRRQNKEKIAATACKKPGSLVISPVERAGGSGVRKLSAVFTIAHISKKIDGTVCVDRSVQEFAHPAGN